jgi:hypothetical protein
MVEAIEIYKKEGGVMPSVPRAVDEKYFLSVAQAIPENAEIIQQSGVFSSILLGEVINSEECNLTEISPDCDIKKMLQNMLALSSLELDNTPSGIELPNVLQEGDNIVDVEQER